MTSWMTIMSDYIEMGRNPELSTTIVHYQQTIKSTSIINNNPFKKFNEVIYVGEGNKDLELRN